MTDTVLIRDGNEVIQVHHNESGTLIATERLEYILKDDSQSIREEVTRFQIVTVSAQGPVGAVGPTGLQGQADTLSRLASEAIGGHRVVQLNGAGKVIYADSNTVAHIGRAVGISEHAAEPDAPVSIRRLGLFEESSWNWIPNKPVFCGAFGVLTQVPPTSGVSQVVGVATSPTTIIVNLREPLLV